jgi:hypothetical protein
VRDFGSSTSIAPNQLGNPLKTAVVLHYMWLSVCL